MLRAFFTLLTIYTATVTAFCAPHSQRMSSFTNSFADSFSKLNVGDGSASKSDDVQDTTSEWDNQGEWETVSKKPKAKKPTVTEVDPSAREMIITVGPQCAGKTTYLSQTYPDIVDVAIDDQPSVYIPIPIAQFLDTSIISSDSLVVGRSLKSRLDSESELRLVLNRLLGNLDPETFSVLLSTVVTSPSLHSCLSSTVESFLSTPSPSITTSTIDLFIRESIFPSALKLSQSSLLFHSRSSVRRVSWGNTNARYNDYKCALEAAEESNRTVTFVKHGDVLNGDFEEIMYRNVKRLAETGRYIPVEGVKRTWDNLEVMRRECWREEGWEWDQRLCERGGYRLGRDRKVRKIKKNNGNRRR
ncbi:hypothetical protein TrVE_jg4136 [Triparma verrucosa]|uniref:P-loop containing nucleoside triphosphate hydrolase protein n=1 Tax=Triparma verrucosa TaxID=1606542 RepID=A0A9W7BG04_9STRA|nr:hypothetical protein TrVE_jg4136 [Triparma verrucosa]